MVSCKMQLTIIFYQMKNLDIINEARRFAVRLLTRAEDNEPKITADLQNIGREISAEIVGLNNKLKTEVSLIQKLIESVGGDLQRFQQKSENINDVLRYTFVLSVDTYSKGFRQTIELLRQLSYKVPENRIWNAWENIGTQFDKGYRGINITIISSQRQKFELQFHTEASFELKTETHHFYKEMRSKNISAKRETELTAIMLELAAKIERLDGV